MSQGIKFFQYKCCVFYQYKAVYLFHMGSEEQEQVALLQVPEEQKQEGNAVDLWASEGTQVIEVVREWEWNLEAISAYCSACFKSGAISVSWDVKGGTITPADPFSPEEDADVLYKAMKGFGTDEDDIISVLGNRTKAQRLAISKAFTAKREKDLLEELEDETRGRFESILQHLMWKRSVLDAQALRGALAGVGTDEAALIEILCTQDSRELLDIKKDYATLFEGRDLDADVESDTVGGFKALLQAILQCNRPPDTGTVVANQAEADAQALLTLGVENWSPSNETVLDVFTQRSFQHLWYLFKHAWPKISEQDLLEQVESECSGDFKDGIKTLIRFSTQIPPVYYAHSIHNALEGLGTEDRQVMYIIVTRSEIDLIDIKEKYLELFEKELADELKGETSGDYEKLLLTLVK